MYSEHLHIICKPSFSSSYLVIYPSPCRLVCICRKVIPSRASEVGPRWLRPNSTLYNPDAVFGCKNKCETQHGPISVNLRTCFWKAKLETPFLSCWMWTKQHVTLGFGGSHLATIRAVALGCRRHYGRQSIETEVGFPCRHFCATVSKWTSRPHYSWTFQGWELIHYFIILAGYAGFLLFATKILMINVLYF